MRWFERGLALVGALLLVVTVTPVVNWWTNALSGSWEEARGETLIVLGGDSIGGGELGYSSSWRSYYAVRAWREGGVKEVLVMGREASGPMRDYMIQHGVPAAAVVAEDRSQTTRENAQAAARLRAGKPGRIVLLTSDYHMRRAAGAFRRVGLEVVTVPCPDVGKRAGKWTERWGLMWELGIETVKWLGYGWRGWR